MANTPLTQALFDSISHHPEVANYLVKHAGDVALAFDAEHARIRITLLKNLDRGTRQERIHSLLYRVITAAEKEKITLTAAQFDIVQQGEGAAGSNPLSGGMALTIRPEAGSETSLYAELQKLAEAEFAKTHPMIEYALSNSRGATLRQEMHNSFHTGSLAHHAQEMVANLSGKLGTNYRVSVERTPEGKPVINITPVSLIAEVMDVFGITTPLEKDPTIAHAIKGAFREVLKRTPVQGEVVMSGCREANVSILLLAGRGSIGAHSWRDMGHGGVERAMGTYS